MTSHRARPAKSLRLFRGDQSAIKQALDTVWVYQPAFAFSKRLLEKLEIRKRLHGGDAFAGQLVAKRSELEAGFQVVHAGLKKAIAVQPAPEADRTKIW